MEKFLLNEIFEIYVMLQRKRYRRRLCNGCDEYDMNYCSANQMGHADEVGCLNKWSDIVQHSTYNELLNMINKDDIKLIYKIITGTDECIDFEISESIIKDFVTKIEEKDYDGWDLYERCISIIDENNILY